MTKSVRVTLYLDTRRKKDFDLYPLKLRVYHIPTTKEKLFRTGYDLTPAEFSQSIKLNSPAKGEKKILRDRKEEIKEINRILIQKAEKIIKALNDFTFDDFERRYYNKSAKLDIIDYYNKKIEDLKNKGRIRTSEVYSLSKDRLIEFLKHHIKKKEVTRVYFDAIKEETLDAFEKYYADKGYSYASIGIYLRPLRTIYNIALADNNSGLKSSVYPFGRNKYKIPTGKNIKRSLTEEELKIFVNYTPDNNLEERVKDFFIFSLLANGMNFKDISELRWGNLRKNNVIAFFRQKTKNTSKGNERLIQAILPELALNIIKKHGNQKKGAKDYIFLIINKNDSPSEKARKLKNFISSVNKQLKHIAEKAELPEGLTTYWARHTFTTQAIRKGASMELLQESLGHADISTTQNYFAGFTTDVKKKLSESLLNFDK
jgi:site-specific recombinase XerD